MDGLKTLESVFGATETLERLEAQVRAKGMSVFARIDHSAGAVQVGLALRPTVLVIFGNALGGTPLMQDNQTAGIDLPLKALVWQDAVGKTWLSYNEAHWIGARHGLRVQPSSPLAVALAGIVTYATQRSVSAL